METSKIGECAHCGQTVGVGEAPEGGELEYEARCHDWPPACRAVCRGCTMEPLHVREEKVMSLNYRRAKFVYEGTRIAAAAAEAPIVPEPYDDRELAFREQFEKVIEKQMGPGRSSNAAALHQDWMKAYEKMGWVYGEVRDPEAKTHPDMVSYYKLGHLERDKDAVFVALCEIARKWVHEPGAPCDDQQELEKRVAALEAERAEWNTTIQAISAVVYPGDRRVTFDAESIVREVKRLRDVRGSVS